MGLDLNLDNYHTEELLDVLQVSPINNEITYEIIQNALTQKLNDIKNSKNELPDTPSNLEEFFTQCFFRIIKDKKLYKQNLIVTNKENEKYSSLNKVILEQLEREQSNKEQEFISVEKSLLPSLDDMHIVQQSSNVIGHHANDYPIPTWNTNLRPGQINPLERKSIIKILNVNTSFRDNYENSKSTDCIITLPYTVKKVVSMKLITTEIPKVVYTFSSDLGSNYFVISNSNETLTKTIDLSNGSYNSTTITTNINSMINEFDVSLSYNNTDGLMTFNYMGTPDASFNLNFDFSYNITQTCPILNTISDINENQFTLGWLLGFRGNSIKKLNAIKKEKTQCVNNQTTRVCSYETGKISDISNVYTGKSSYTGEAIFDSLGTKYFLLSVDDYQNNHIETFISPFREQSLVDKNVLAKISTDCCKEDCCDGNGERTYFGPVDLTRLHIKLFDEFGRILDVNNADYSFTLKLELMYDL